MAAIYLPASATSGVCVINAHYAAAFCDQSAGRPGIEASANQRQKGVGTIDGMFF